MQCSSAFDVACSRANARGNSSFPSKIRLQIAKTGGNETADDLLVVELQAEDAMRVFDVMTPVVQLCTPEDTVRDAAEAMAELDVGLLPVAEDNCLVGMISDRDIAVRAVGKGCGPDTKIRDVMTPGVKYCFDDQDIESVSWNMGDIQVRRLPVLSRQKRLVGIISLGDIARSRAGDVTAASLHQISQPGGQHTQAG
jgi:CBS domain-containing protein